MLELASASHPAPSLMLTMALPLKKLSTVSVSPLATEKSLTVRPKLLDTQAIGVGADAAGHVE